MAVKSKLLKYANEADKLISEITTTPLPMHLSESDRSNLAINRSAQRKLTSFAKDIRYLASGLK